jgi:hypothetical protein
MTPHENSCPHPQTAEESAQIAARTSETAPILTNVRSGLATSAVNSRPVACPPAIRVHNGR